MCQYKEQDLSRTVDDSDPPHPGEELLDGRAWSEVTVLMLGPSPTSDHGRTDGETPWRRFRTGGCAVGFPLPRAASPQAR